MRQISLVYLALALLGCFLVYNFAFRKKLKTQSPERMKSLDVTSDNREPAPAVTIEDTDQETGYPRIGSAVEYLCDETPLSTVLSVTNILHPKRTRKVLEALETNKIELTNDRHMNYPTRDIPTYRLPCLEVETGKAFNDVICRAISDTWGVPEEHLLLIDEFLVEYTADGHNHLDEHIDGHTFSYIIQLNEISEFKGGGTRFVDTNQVFHAAPKGVIIFCGRRKHQGLPISEGRRIIITGFVDVAYTKELAYKFEPILYKVNAHVRAFNTERIPNLHLYPNLSFILDANRVHDDDIFNILMSGGTLDETALRPPSEKWSKQLNDSAGKLNGIPSLYRHIEGHISSRDLKICIAGNFLRIATGETDCKKYPELCFNAPYLT